MAEKENESQSQSPALFEDRSRDLIAQGDAAAVARATQEIQAALVIAQRFPRDEVKAKARIIEACKRKGLAEVAEYEYSRGGTRITGPTVDLLRAVANRWGNLQFGWEETERRDGQSSVRCFAWDLQSNGKAFRTFVVRHWRDTQAGGYEITDERDIYELLANMASRRVRACLEEVIDADIVEAAITQCRRTLKEGEKLPIKDRAAAVLIAFQEFGVTQEMIEARLGNKLDAVSENQLASLRRVHTALKDGVGKREDYFKPSAAPEKPHFEPKGQTQQSTTTPAEEKELAAAGLAPVTTPEHKPEPKPEPKESKPDDGQSPIRLLRDLARVSKVKEGVLLGFLAETGSTDGSVSSLEELQISFPAVVKAACKDWAGIAKRIKEATGS